MKKLLFLILTVLTFSFVACEEDGVVTFSGTMEKPHANDKTQLNGLDLSWVLGDSIKVFDGTNWYPFWVYMFDGGTAQFTSEVTSQEFNTHADGYEAIYPSTCCSDCSFEFPETQIYVDNSMGDFPMYSYNRGHKFSFNNLCGVLSLKINQNSNKKIRAIKLTSSQFMSGPFILQEEDGKYVAKMTADGSHSVVLFCRDYVQYNGIKNFYISLPAQTYTNLEVAVITDDGVSFCKTATGNDLVIERNTVTEVSLKLWTGTQVPHATIDGYSFADALYDMDVPNLSIVFEYGSTNTNGVEVQKEGTSSPIYMYLDGNVCHVTTPAYQIEAKSWLDPYGQIVALDALFEYVPSTRSIDFGDFFHTENNVSMTYMFAWLADLEYLYLGRQFELSTVSSSNYDWMCDGMAENSTCRIYCTPTAKAKLMETYVTHLDPDHINWHLLE